MNDPLGVLNEMPLSQNAGANGSESNGNQQLMTQITFNVLLTKSCMISDMQSLLATFFMSRILKS